MVCSVQASSHVTGDMVGHMNRPTMSPVTWSGTLTHQPCDRVTWFVNRTHGFFLDDSMCASVFRNLSARELDIGSAELHGCYVRSLAVGGHAHEPRSSFCMILGQGHGDRAIAVRADEYEYGLSLLDLCRRLRPAPKAMLRTVCRDASAQLRAGKSHADCLECARYRGLLADMAVASMKCSDAPGTAEVQVVHAIASALAGASLALDTPEPPIVAPATPLSREHMKLVVGTGQRLLQQWAPLASDRLAERLPSGAGATAHVKLEPLSYGLDSDASASAFRAAAKDIQRTGRRIGLLAFVVYAHTRRVRAHALLGLRSFGFTGARLLLRWRVVARNSSRH